MEISKHLILLGKIIKKADRYSRKDSWAWNLSPVYHFSVKEELHGISVIAKKKDASRYESRGLEGWSCPSASFPGETECVHLAILTGFLPQYPAGKMGSIQLTTAVALIAT